MKLVVARHAPVAVHGLCYGQRSVPVEMTADVAAARIAGALDADRPSRLWSSPLPRCADVATILGRELDAPHDVDERLLEISFGAWEGKTWDEIQRTDGEAMQRWMNDWRNETPPGGERVDDLMARVGAWRAELTRGTHLLVAHSGVVRALRVLAGATWEDAMRLPVRNLAVERL